MSPSINELFSAPGSEAEDDFDIDMDKLMAGVDQSIKESTRFADQEIQEADPPVAQDTPTPSVTPSQESEAAEETGPQPDSGGLPEVVAESQPEEEVNPPDPLGLLFAEEAKDPAKRERLLQALRDPEPTQVADPGFQLPEDVEPGSVAAKVLEDNYETRRQLARLADGQKAQSEAMERQRATDAATQAGNEFAARYEGRLDNDDVMRIAQAAGASGLAARLAAGNDDLRGAYLQALESTLWTTESLRAKVLDPAAPKEPTPAEVDAAESKPRKRKLTALSSSASPVSAPPPKASPLETRADGRLTGESRQRTVMDLATRLNRERNEGGY